MTVIDKLSFQFRMADEQFARELYADWDGFCRHCATDVLEEYFSGYDNKDIYMEIDRLELDLGGIPQEEFHSLFPVRLREALERSFVPYLNGGDAAHPLPEETGTGHASLSARKRRLDNLLHYLEYGFCLPGWYGQDFDLHEELLHLGENTDLEKLLALLSDRSYALERLFLQAGGSALLLPVWLPSPTLGQHEKQRYLIAMLECVPQAIIRFIRETRDTGGMEGMAELLENPHVRRIMATETENHAEIDVPEYWYRLYGWLLEYYPFNGVPMFGDKRHFQLHLNRRLLSFIRKRDYQAYLSKADLTVQFLLEVFGADYYLTVLDIIYHNQRLNADGSPATGDSYAWELYYMLLQLSLIKVGRGKDENAGGQSADGEGTEMSPYAAASAALREHIGSFGEWLENTELTDSGKRTFLLRLAKEEPEMLVRWLKERPERRYVSLLAALLDRPSVLLLTGQVSLQLVEAVVALSDALNEASTSVPWLKGTSGSRLTVALHIAVLDGIGAGTFQTAESVSMQIVRMAGLLYKEITGKEVVCSATSSATVSSAAVADMAGAKNGSGIVALSADSHLRAEKWTGFAAKDNAGDAAELVNAVTIEGFEISTSLREFIGVIAKETPLFAADGEKIREIRLQKHLPDEENSDAQRLSVLYTVLLKWDIPEEVQRMLVLQWFDTCHGKESELVTALQSEKLLAKAIGLLDDRVLRHIAMRLAGYAFGAGGQNMTNSAMQFVGLLVENVEVVASLVSRPVKELWQALFVFLSSGHRDSGVIAAANRVGFATRLLFAIAGNDKVRVIVELLIRRLLRTPLFIGTPEKEAADGGDFFSAFGNDALLALLIRIQESVRSEKLDDHVPETTYGEGNISGTMSGKAVLGIAAKNPENVKTAYGATTDDDLSMQTGDMDLSEVWTTFEQHLNDILGITGWLRNGAFTSAQKWDVFHRYMKDNPENAMRLVKETIASEENAVALWAEITDEEMLPDLIRHTDNALSKTLTQVIKIVKSTPIGTDLFTGSSVERSRSMKKAFLLLMATEQRPGDMDAEEIVRQFLSHWHYVLTGSEEYTSADREQWRTAERQVIDTVVSGTPVTADDIETVAFKETGMPSVANRKDSSDEEPFDDLMAWLTSPSVSDTAKSQRLRHYARWQPKLLWSLVRYATDSETGKNIPFRQWNGWLGKETWLEMITGVSLSLGETLQQTVGTVSEQYEVSESVLSEGLIRFIAGYPAGQASYVDQPSIVRKYISILAPLAWEGGIPASVQEQAGITDSGDSEHGKSDKTSPSDEQHTQGGTENKMAGTNGSGVGEQSSEADHDAAERQQLALDNIIEEVEARLHITDAGQSLEKAVQPEYIEIPNAGLCLLAIWFPRLFGMLGLLTEDKKDLKDTEARIRAIFILQRLVTDEPREYKEQELAFNRILTGCPFYVPLPRTLELTDNEIQTVESMIAGVKNNWNKLRNTSVKGFRHSFIERPGKLEQREDKWVLYVESRSYDILLDSLPWSYRLIRLPWLKKRINAVWRDKEEFDF